MFNKIIKSLPEIVFRLIIGFIFIQSGFGKLMNLNQVIEYFNSLGIAYAQLQAPVVALIEFICGVFIVVGFLPRLSSLALVGVMFGAIKFAKADEITDLNSLLSMSEFLYISILLYLLVHGSQILSLGHLLKKKFRLKACEFMASC